MSEIKPGDIVQLKSRGPAMTVNMVDGCSGWITAMWFPNLCSEPDQGMRYEGAFTNKFYPEALVKI